MKISCPYCKHEHKVADPSSGQIVECPFCRMKSVLEVTEATLPDSKSCPMCGETILAVAKKCKHCGEYLEPNLRQVSQKKDKTVYCLLALFLGGIGAHNFYGGQNASGIIKIIITIFMFIVLVNGGPFYVLGLITLVWSIVDMIAFNPVEAAMPKQKPPKMTTKEKIKYYICLTIAFLFAFAAISFVIYAALNAAGVFG